MPPERPIHPWPGAPGEAASFCGVAASFEDFAAWKHAGVEAREAGQTFEAYAPVADETAMRTLRPGNTQNQVRLWTLLGGLFGGTMALCMTIWMSMNWPLVVGGKPIVSWPPFIDICFEMSVLYGSFACMFAFFALGRVPHLTLAAAYRPEFAVDRFGLFIECRREHAEVIRRQLEQAGAERTWLVANAPRGRLAEPAPLVGLHGTGGGQ